jgi:hypothetical protein
MALCEQVTWLLLHIMLLWCLIIVLIVEDGDEVLLWCVEKNVSELIV